jgi:hypothetical protein
MVPAEVPRGLEPKARHLREHLAFEGNRREDPIESAQTVTRNDDPPPVR